MNLTTCKTLFALFAGLADATAYQALLDAAVAEVTAELRAGADDTDTRLPYYCAAVANLRYAQMLAARSTVAHTYAGTLASAHDDSVAVGFAERLVQEYRASAAPLLKDGKFVFTGLL